MAKIWNRGDSMKYFIRKDIRLLTTINILIPISGLVFKGSHQIFMMDIHPRWIYGFFAFFFINIVLLNLAQNGEEKGADVFINSLPIDKVYIVGSRYVTLFLYLIYILLITVISSFTKSYIFGYEFLYTIIPMTIEDILSIFTFCILFLSIFLPFQYYDTEKFESCNQVFIYILIIAPIIIYRFGRGFLDSYIFSYIVALDSKIMLIILLLLSISLYILSMYISFRIYKNREFS